MVDKGLWGVAIVEELYVILKPLTNGCCTQYIEIRIYYEESEADERSLSCVFLLFTVIF